PASRPTSPRRRARGSPRPRKPLSKENRREARAARATPPAARSIRAATAADSAPSRPAGSLRPDPNRSAAVRRRLPRGTERARHEWRSHLRRGSSSYLLGGLARELDRVFRPVLFERSCKSDERRLVFHHLGELAPRVKKTRPHGEHGRVDDLGDVGRRHPLELV